jgi:drug/metabolite transporter (DMT)-like permease
MFYLSALIAIVGAVSYQFVVKKVPASINPLVSVLASYVVVTILGFALLPLFPAEGGLGAHLRQLSWIQVAVAGSILLLELGFLLMFRYGWNLGTGNLVTGAIVNVALLGLGVFVLGEKVTALNAVGIVLCIVGVVLIGYRA